MRQEAHHHQHQRHDPHLLRRVLQKHVVQLHLSGHTDKGTHCIDTHDHPMRDEVWELYREVHRRAGGVATIYEWDAEIPSFDEVHEQVLKARQFQGSP